MNDKDSLASSRISMGIGPLDFILNGGLPPHHLYLIQGNPGSGKTTLGLQFLLAGADKGETGLYVTLSETAEELTEIARSHRWQLDGINIHELSPSEDSLDTESQYTMFQLSELELSKTTSAILEKVGQLKPQRIVFDSLSEMRLLAQNPLRYRRQILALKQYFIWRGSTVLLLDDKTSAETDIHLESIAHGVINLEQMAPEFGAERRRLRISKLRGVNYRGGYHDFVIRKGGLEIFPRIANLETRNSPANDERGPLSSGLPALDSMLGGGLDAGSSVLFLGPAGTGKSSLAINYAIAAAERGERATLFIFDETKATLLKRTKRLNSSILKYVESGQIAIHQIDPAEVSPGEFASMVRQTTEQHAGRPPSSVVIIDSLNGYLASMPEERFLIIQLHELLSFLASRRVTTIMVVAQHGMVQGTPSPIDTSYLSDVVIVLRYFEAFGSVRQAISVVKRRTGPHERTIREFSIEQGRICIGEPLIKFEGVLSGVPHFFGEERALASKGSQ